LAEQGVGAADGGGEVAVQRGVVEQRPGAAVARVQLREDLLERGGGALAALGHGAQAGSRLGAVLRQLVETRFLPAGEVASLPAELEEGRGPLADARLH